MTTATDSDDTVLPEAAADTAAADLAMINAMMQAGRDRVVIDGQFLVLWGALLATAFLTAYANAIGIIQLSGLWIWGPVTVGGWAASLWLGYRLQVLYGPLSQQNPAIIGYTAVWVAMGLVSLMGVVMQIVDAPSFGGRSMAIQSCALSGVGFFVTASLSRLRWLYGIAAAWWALYMFYGLMDELPREVILMQAFAFIAFLLLPGITLMRINAKQG